MNQKSSFMFDRWPRFAFRHPWRALGVAVLVFAVIFAAASALGAKPNNVFRVPGLEAQSLADLMVDRFPQQAGDSATIVVRSARGLDDPAERSRLEALVGDLMVQPNVVAVGNPYTDETISADRHYARIDMQFDNVEADLSRESLDALDTTRLRHTDSDFTVEIGGSIAWAVEPEPADNSAMIGVIVAVIILVIAFGSIVSMGVPVVTALVGTFAGLSLTTLLAGFIDMPDFAPNLGMMIGLGIGIDYALLIVTRFREGLARGLSVEESIALASRTAGRSVVFAGGTVVIALTGVWLSGIPAFGAAGTAAAMVAVTSVATAVFVMPVVLRLLGRKINRWHIPGVPEIKPDHSGGTGYRLSRAIQRRPLVAAVASAALLLALAAPVVGLRLGYSDDGNLSEATTARRAYDLLSEGFGPGFNGTIVVGMAIDSPADAAASETVRERLTEVGGVAGVSPVIFNEAGTAAIIEVTPTTSPQSEESRALVWTVRDAARSAAAGTGVKPLVGGAVGANVELAELVTGRMPVFLAAIIGLSFLLLMMVFRSVLVPAKAAIMNLLSIGAAYGVLVAIFQWGWLADVVGVSQEGPIEFFVPMFLFAVLFGLSMDYEVFLISRIKEEYDGSGDNSEAIARGLSATSRLITAAAMIMISVFASFALGDSRVMKEFGIGLAVAIFVDATIVRMILVPATMHLAGQGNWWLPGWLDRILPRISVDEAGTEREVARIPSGTGGAEPAMAATLDR